MRVLSFRSQEPKVLINTGNLSVEVTVVCLMFTSFEGEVLTGTVQAMDAEGMT